MDEPEAALRREIADLRDFSTMMAAVLLSKGVLTQSEMALCARTYAGALLDRDRAKALGNTFEMIIDEALEFLHGQDLPQP